MRITIVAIGMMSFHQVAALLMAITQRTARKLSATTPASNTAAQAVPTLVIRPLWG